MHTPHRRGARAALLGLLLVLPMLLANCAGGDGPRNTNSIRIILGHGAAPGNPRSDAALEFERLVEEKSNGAIDIQILGQESVGSDSEMMVSVASGSLDMTINSQGPFSSYVPEAALIGLPFLFENSQHAYAVLDGPIEEELRDQAAQKGFHVLNFWDNGMRDITNSKHPINTPEDVAGLKLRTPDDPMTIDIFNALGANPTPMAFGELYLGLRQGAVDGQENPVVNIKSARLEEVQQYLAVTGHKYEMNPFLMSSQRWDRLDPEQQQIITEAADEAQQLQREEMNTQTAEIYTEFESIMEVSHPDREVFKEATNSVYDTWQQKYPDFYATITEAADQTRAQFQSGAL